MFPHSRCQCRFKPLRTSARRDSGCGHRRCRAIRPRASPPREPRSRTERGRVSFCWRICEELYLGFFDDACPNGVKNLGRNFLKRPEFRGELRNPKFLQEGGEPEQIAG